MHKNSKTVSFIIAQKASLDFSLCDLKRKPPPDLPDRQINQWCTGPTAPTHITHSLCLYSYLQVCGGTGAGTSRRNTNKPNRTRWFPQKTGRVRKETRIIWCAGCFLSCRISWLCSVDWSDIIRLCRLVQILMWFAELVQVILTCSPAVDRHSAVGWI